MPINAMEMSYCWRSTRQERGGLESASPLCRRFARDQGSATEFEHLRAGVVLEELVEERSGDVVSITELRDRVGRGINRAKLFRLRQRSASRERRSRVVQDATERLGRELWMRVD